MSFSSFLGNGTKFIKELKEERLSFPPPPKANGQAKLWFLRGKLQFVLYLKLASDRSLLSSSVFLSV